MEISYMMILGTMLLTVVKYTKAKKHQINLKGFDTSAVLHALVADDETPQNDVADITLSDPISPIKGSGIVNENEQSKLSKENGTHKTNKRHDKGNKKHKKRNNKGKKKSKKSKSCCENGGLCVLGSFCHCPKNFVGRFCQFEVKSRDCGPVKHEELFREGCTMCRCIDGVLNCIPQMYAGCDDKQVEPIFFNFNQVNNNQEINTKLIVSADDDMYRNNEQDNDKMAADILHTLEKMAASKSTIVSSNSITCYISLSILMLLVKNYYFL